MELEQHSEEKKLIGLIDNVLETVKHDWDVLELRIEEKIEEFKRNFRYDQGGSWDNNDFKDPATLCAFFYKYSPYSAVSMRHFTLQAIEHCDEFRSALNKRDLRFVSLGGGPGAELAGFLSALIGDFELQTLHITVVDWVKGWFHIATELVKESYRNASDLKAEKKIQKVIFFQHDVSRVHNEYTEVLKSAHVVIMRNLLSIVQGWDRINEIKQIVATCLQPGALLFYIDSQYQDFSRYGLEPLPLPPTSTGPYWLPFDIANGRQRYSGATFHIFTKRNISTVPL